MAVDGKAARFLGILALLMGWEEKRTAVLAVWSLGTGTGAKTERRDRGITAASHQSTQ
jgi:hypothetical protein